MKTIKYFLLIAVTMIIVYAVIHGVISYLYYYNNVNNTIYIGKDNNGYYILYKVK